MMKIKSNYPVEEIYAFRESGYIKKLIELLAVRLPSEYELYLHFQLSKWKGEDLVIDANNRKKVVLCVGDEAPNTTYSFQNKVDYIFRTYLPAPMHRKGKLYHLPVGPSAQFTATTVSDFISRPHNVFFSGNLHLGRANLYRAFTGAYLLPFALLHRTKKLLGTHFDGAFPASIVRFSTGFHNGITPTEYATLMRSSKICLCPAGVENPETMRHFEAAQLGSIIVTTPMPAVPMYQNAPFVVLSSWRELHKTVKQLLAEPNRMLDLHHQTLEWWRTQASAEAVVATICQTIRA